MIANSVFRTPHRNSRVCHRRGLALVVILACVVLLTVMVMAYFSYSSLQRQISSSSANQTSAEIFALGAANSVIGDLKQEIAAGSRITPITIGAVKVTNYFPATAAVAVPAIAGFATNGGLENLVKVSRYGTNFFPASYTNAGIYPPSSRAINLSTTNASKNGRYVNAEDWNKALLLGRQDTNSTTDDTPVAAFVPPDWILVDRAGRSPSNPSISSVQWTPDASNTNAVVGRYAYAIYDEGGLLDANVAGYPSGMSATNAAFKNALAYADLTRIGLTTAQIDGLVQWRNHASIEGGTKATNYPAFVAGNTSGFLRAANTNLFSGKSDQLFVSRRQLLGFFNKALGGSTTPGVRNALQYLTHFSRDLNQPSYVAAVQTDSSAPVVLSTVLGGNAAVNGDKLINPSFPGTRAQTAFLRNDGTTAKVGEPLVNKRFPLNRLAWITYKGPSASRTQSDADIQALIANGIPWTYLQEGTAANIEKHFGLTWDSGNKRWIYDVHRGTVGSNRIIKMLGRPPNVPAANATRYVQDSGRDANFFELLKAGISLGSLGKVAATSSSSVSGAMVPPGYAEADVPANLSYNFDSSVEYHIIQLGANILSAVNPTSYPVRIAFDDGSARGLWEFQGVTDLPYLSYVFNGVLRSQMSDPPVVGGGSASNGPPAEYPLAKPGTVTLPGKAYAIQVPAVWNPYDPNGAGAVLRPGNFRVVIDSNDPISLAKGSSNKPVWCAALASSRSITAGGSNNGIDPPGTAYFSYQATSSPTSSSGVQISDAVTFNDSNGSLYREPTLIFRTTVGGASRTAGNITSIDNNPLPGATDPAGTAFTPLVLGEFPLAFMYSSTATAAAPVLFTGVGAIGPGGVTAGPVPHNNRVYFTYRLQYQDEGGAWVTYDTKYGRTTLGLFPYQSRFNDPQPVILTAIRARDVFSTWSWAAAIDPRSARFGLFLQIGNDQRAGAYLNNPPASASGWVFGAGGAPAVAQGITYPVRPDNFAGFQISNFDQDDQLNVWSLNGNTAPGNLLPSRTLDVPFPSFAAGWTRPIAKARSADVPTFPLGMYAQNNPSVPFYWGRFNGADQFPTSMGNSYVQPAYYADADGVVRRGAGAYVPPTGTTSASTPVGLPAASIQGFSGKDASLITPASASPFSQSQSRPLLLHRPFRAVAELGTVFRDVPWKNLDFFTPESGDAALLDLFCINETSTPKGLVAGKVNLNTRQSAVLDAIVSGAYVDDPKVNNATVGTVSSSLSQAIGAALATRTGNATFGPLQNVSELVGKWVSGNAIPSGVGYTPTVPGANSGIDLPFPNYKDGKLSYVGFSGSPTPTGNDLSGVFALASNFGGNTTLQTSMSLIQRFREAPMRALAASGQTRVWNLMIDLVAQVGRYPSTAAASPNPLEAFLVEGETRLWVHLSIDRLTGEILDKQIEVVKE